MRAFLQTLSKLSYETKEIIWYTFLYNAEYLLRMPFFPVPPKVNRDYLDF